MPKTKEEIRDQFAAAAIAGLLMNRRCVSPDEAKHLAADAFRMADEMMEQRVERSQVE